MQPDRTSSSFFEGKKRKLILGLLFDGIGMLSLLIPGLGPVLDLIWAPAAAWLMTRMYSGTQGKVAAVVSFVEEVLPGTDFIPTFTLMWAYTYWIRRKKPDGNRIGPKAQG